MKLQRRQQDGNQRVRRALEALHAAMREATIDELQFLHTVLEKGSADYGFDVARGPWGEIGSHRSEPAYRSTACPLTALALGRAPTNAEDLARAEQVANERLARYGYSPHDFYAAWDRGLISRLVALRWVDRMMTQRTMAPRRRSGIR